MIEYIFQSVRKKSLLLLECFERIMGPGYGYGEGTGTLLFYIHGENVRTFSFLDNFDLNQT